MGHRSGRFAAVALIATGATVGGAAIASAQVYPPTSCSLSVDAVVAVPGESVVAATAGCEDTFAAGAVVTFTLALAAPDGDGDGASGGGGGGTGGGNPDGGTPDGGNGGAPEPSGEVVGTATADADGNVSAPVPVPAGASGAFALTASGPGADGSTVTLTANLTAAVSGAGEADAGAGGSATSRRSADGLSPAAAADELLPSEGFTPLWLVAPAFVLLTLSTAGVLGLRRRALLRARG
jgi:hypothetical protein